MTKLNLKALAGNTSQENPISSPTRVETSENLQTPTNISQTPNTAKISLKNMQVHTHESGDFVVSSENTKKEEPLKSQNQDFFMSGEATHETSSSLEASSTDSSEEESSGKHFMIQDGDTKVSLQTEKPKELFSNYNASYNPTPNIPEKQKEKHSLPTQSIPQSTAESSEKAPIQKKSFSFHIAIGAFIVIGGSLAGGAFLFFQDSTLIQGNIQETPALTTTSSLIESDILEEEILQTNENINVNTNISSPVDNNEKTYNIVDEETKRYLIEKYKSKYQSN